MIWIQYRPVDTLFIRGGEPMEAGVHHESSTEFPPPPSVLSGAIRTALLYQNNCKISDYYAGTLADPLMNQLGEAGESAPFSVTGPLFLKKQQGKGKDIVLIPAPYTWFSTAPETALEGETALIISNLLTKEVLDELKITASSMPLLWAGPAQEATGKEKNPLKSLGQCWVDINILASPPKALHWGENIFAPESLWSSEIRTGIALETNRTVKTGHLYSARHTRLNPGIEMLFSVDTPLSLETNGILTLGGEQRCGEYQILDENAVTFPKIKDATQFMSLGLLEANEKIKKLVIATGKTRQIGGWNMKKHFHKPTTTYLPGGTVLNMNFNNQLIPIA